VSAADLRAFATQVARAVGVPEEDARAIADGMVWSELRGIDVGIKRLPTLVKRIHGGGTSSTPRLRIVRESASLAVLDGDAAWGQVTSVRAMRLAIAKAKTTGMGACVVRNTGNSLAMGYYPWLAAKERLIGLAITNALPLQAPWGSKHALLGNQAYALACPSERHAPIIFDSATTAISWVGILEYAARGEQIPPGVALNSAGEPTIDPAQALAGVLLPAAGHRGYGISVMFEILSGVLSGGEHFAPLPNDRGTGHVAGQSTFLLAIDPSVCMPYETFVERVDELIDRIHACPPAPGFERVYVPGERGAEVAAIREREGIPLSQERVSELRGLSREFGIRMPESLAS
jgi:LDH2 family malate/lactate/ureidoglycolate dehydrogenase